MKLYGWAKNALKLQRAIAEANVAKKGNFTEEDVKEQLYKFIPQFFVELALIHPNPFTPHPFPQEFFIIKFPIESYPITVTA